MDNIHGDSAIIVREMDPSEKDATKALFKQLNPAERLMFVLIFNDIQKAAVKHAGCCLVAVTGGTIVGTISLHLKEIAGKKCGFIDALIADKTHRGQGISKMLIDRSLAWCEQNGCQNIFATADRYNSRSWNMFIHKGFSLYETTRQIQDFGAGFLKLWNAEGYYIGFGTFFLKKEVGGTKPKQTRSAFHFLAAWGWMTLVWWIISFQGGISFEKLPAYLVIIGITLGLHELFHILVARAFGLQAYFKSWDSGYIFMLLLSLIGGFYPVYGSTYLKQVDWDYPGKINRRTNGIIYIFGPIVHICLAVAFWYLQTLVPAGIWLGAINIGYSLNLWLAIFNLLPIKGTGGFAWDGAKIFDWNKPIWTSLLCVSIIIIVLHSI